LVLIYINAQEYNFLFNKHEHAINVSLAFLGDKVPLSEAGLPLKIIMYRLFA